MQNSGVFVEHLVDNKTPHGRKRYILGREVFFKEINTSLWILPPVHTTLVFFGISYPRKSGWVLGRSAMHDFFIGCQFSRFVLVRQGNKYTPPDVYRLRAYRNDHWQPSSYLCSMSTIRRGISIGCTGLVWSGDRLYLCVSQHTGIIFCIFFFP